jgi:hypothetical protein
MILDQDKEHPTFITLVVMSRTEYMTKTTKSKNFRHFVCTVHRTLKGKKTGHTAEIL